MVDKHCNCTARNSFTNELVTIERFSSNTTQDVAWFNITRILGYASYDDVFISNNRGNDVCVHDKAVDVHWGN
jgi:hypothetical protein